MNTKNIHIIEYGFFYTGENPLNQHDSLHSVFLEPHIFQSLECFVLENNQQATPFFRLGIQKRYGKILQAQQYMGVLQLREGITIEILPKITAKQANAETIAENKKLFLKMLAHLNNTSFKHLNTAQLDTHKHFPLLEIFITQFCDDISVLIQKGLVSRYNTKEENSFFVKGRLNIHKQIQHNSMQAQRFFIEYDEFSVNRPENRLLKSTLLFLLSKTQSAQNRSRLQEYLFVFDSLKPSQNMALDFSRIQYSRSMNAYKNPLQWAKIFLLHKSITPISGKSIAWALLFDMNTVFEEYVTYCFQKSKRYKNYRIISQKQSKSLVEFPQKKYRLKPDIVFEKNKKVCIIADTKWKIIKTEKDISQSDIYQMFAYMKKYIPTEKEIWLIYPYISETTSLQNMQKYLFTNPVSDSMQESLHITFFDIEKMCLV